MSSLVVEFSMRDGEDPYVEIFERRKVGVPDWRLKSHHKGEAIAEAVAVQELDDVWTWHFSESNEAEVLVDISAPAEAAGTYCVKVERSLTARADRWEAVG